MVRKHFFCTALALVQKRDTYHCSKGLWEGSTITVASELKVAHNENRLYSPSHSAIPKVNQHPEKGQATDIL